MSQQIRTRARNITDFPTIKDIRPSQNPPAITVHVTAVSFISSLFLWMQGNTEDHDVEVVEERTKIIASDGIKEHHYAIRNSVAHYHMGGIVLRVPHPPGNEFGEEKIAQQGHLGYFVKPAFRGCHRSLHGSSFHLFLSC